MLESKLQQAMMKMANHQVGRSQDRRQRRLLFVVYQPRGLRLLPQTDVRLTLISQVLRSVAGHLLRGMLPPSNAAPRLWSHPLLAALRL